MMAKRNPAKLTTARFKTLNEFTAKTGWKGRSEDDVESLRGSMARGMKDARGGKPVNKGYSHQYAAAYQFGRMKATESKARVAQRRVPAGSPKGGQFAPKGR